MSSTELITLGTAAGPAIRGPEPGISSAIVVDGKHYLVDFGLGCVRAAHAAGLRGREFVAGFVTHLHSDHVIELPGFLLWNWGAPVDGYDHPIAILGPGQDPTHRSGASLAGTSQMVEHTLRAYSYDLDIRVSDEARPDMSRLVQVADIATPAQHSPNVELPFPVYSDERVTVTAALVEHPPVFPALAYRFDTASGSVTFSGDTAECDALAMLAEGTDVLVHEAVNLDFFTQRGFDPAFIKHQSVSHTSPEGAGRIATRAGAGMLVLSHLAGIATAEEWRERAATTYSGPIHVASSGDRIPVKAPVRETVG